MDENQNEVRQVVIHVDGPRAGKSILAEVFVAIAGTFSGAVAVARDAGPVTREELDDLLAPLRFPEPRFFPEALPRKAKTREAQWKAERNFTRPNKPRKGR